jgi:hypothetical protein
MFVAPPRLEWGVCSKSQRHTNHMLPGLSVLCKSGYLRDDNCSVDTGRICSSSADEVPGGKQSMEIHPFPVQIIHTYWNWSWLNVNSIYSHTRGSENQENQNSRKKKKLSSVTSWPSLVSWFGISWTLFNFSRWVYSIRQPGYSINPTHILLTPTCSNTPYVLAVQSIDS